LNYKLFHVHTDSFDKKDWLLSAFYGIIIEDRLKTANLLSAEGITTFLVEQPWNINRSTHKDVCRVPTLLEAVDIILKESDYGKTLWRKK
jgi:hypothetical protein